MVTVKFNSGGRNHSSGFGEWDVELDEKNNLHIIHSVNEETKIDETNELKASSSDCLRKKFDLLNIKECEPLGREAETDEIIYTFTQTEWDTSDVYQVWADDQNKKRVIKDIITKLRNLIRQYTKQAAVI